MDLFAAWEIESGISKHKKKNESIEFRMFLKIRIWFPLSYDDLDTVVMTYS